MQYKISNPDTPAVAILNQKVESSRTKFALRAFGLHLPEIRVKGIFHSRKDVILNNQFVISLPVCNQENLISTTLEHLYKNVKYESTLVVILDTCHDSSKEIVLEFLQNVADTYFINTVVVLETDDDLFESTCENLVLEVTNSQIFVSMQADIMFDDGNILDRIRVAFKEHDNLLGISSRAILPASNAKSPKYSQIIYKCFGVLNAMTSKFIHKVHLPPFLSANYYLGDVSKPPQNRMRFFAWQKRTIYLGDTLIRGPIFWRTDYLRKLGGFNDVKYPLGGDERELCVLGKNIFSFDVGYLPSNCYTNLWTGTSHNFAKRTDRTIQNLEMRYALQKRIGDIFEFKLSKKSLKANRKRCLKIGKGH